MHSNTVGSLQNVYIGETKHSPHKGTSEDNTLQCKHIQQPDVLMTDMYTLQRLLNIIENPPCAEEGGSGKACLLFYCSTNTGFCDGIDVGAVASPTAK